MTGEIAAETGLDRDQVSHVIESFCRSVHKGLYEYEGGYGGYMTEELIHEITDFAWLHLYQFALLDRMLKAPERPEDDLGISTEVLKHLGGAPRWAKYFREMREWKMSSRFGRGRAFYR